MALIPKLKYPAQIDVSDPAYPQGKARNVGAPGDGTGTPLEREWVNDLFGFQQALLAAAAITPNGAADKVGASQYLTAVQTIVDGLAAVLFTKTAFLDKGYVWTGQHGFVGTPLLQGTETELYYAANPGGAITARHRTMFLPLSLGFTHPESDWVLVSSLSGPWLNISPVGQVLNFPLRLPQACTLTGVSVAVMKNTDFVTPLKLEVIRQGVDLAPVDYATLVNTGGKSVLMSATAASTSNPVEVIGTSLAHVVDNTSGSYFAAISASSGGTGPANYLGWIRVTYAETRASGNY
jgi:hypothetical protein